MTRTGPAFMPAAEHCAERLVGAQQQINRQRQIDAANRRYTSVCHCTNGVHRVNTRQANSD